MVKLSVIIPAFNEAENFKQGCLQQAVNYLGKQTYSWEVILVDDGSTDETGKLLQSFTRREKGFRYLKIPHGGKHIAVKTGVLAARGGYVLFTDFDQSVPLLEVEKMFPQLEAGADVVVGLRSRKGIKEGGSWLVLLRSRIFAWLSRYLAGVKVRDTQCGFKIFRQPVAQKLFQSLKVHQKSKTKKPFMGAFDVELLFLAQRSKYKVVSVPVSFRWARSNRLTKTEPWQMLWALMKIQFLNLLGRYDEREE